jgi:hypothetical protein
MLPPEFPELGQVPSCPVRCHTFGLNHLLDREGQAVAEFLSQLIVKTGQRFIGKTWPTPRIGLVGNHKETGLDWPLIGHRDDRIRRHLAIMSEVVAYSAGRHC